MRNVTNYYIANLAFADVIIALFCIPFQVGGRGGARDNYNNFLFSSPIQKGQFLLSFELGVFVLPLCVRAHVANTAFIFLESQIVANYSTYVYKRIPQLGVHN